MKLTIFHPWNVMGGWNAIGGYAETLRRMGHEVVHCHFPGNFPGNLPGPQLDQIRLAAPTLDQLNSCDAILSMYHEYTQLWLAAVYGLETWRKIKVPIIACFNESMWRTDLGLPARLPELKSWAKYFYFPATQDADQFGGTWMPFGIDTTMFNPALNPAGGHETDKKYNLGFIGSLYQSRKNYLEKLSAGAGDDLSFNLGQVFVQDLSGVLPKESTLLLAENYRQIKVFFCLPPISRLIIEKVFEVMACGTFVMYPKLPGAAAENLSIFEHGKEIVYYEPGYMADNIKQIRYYLAHEDEREHIAAAGCKKVHELYRLDKMLEKMLEARPTL